MRPRSDTQFIEWMRYHPALHGWQKYGNEMPMSRGDVSIEDTTGRLHKVYRFSGRKERLRYITLAFNDIKRLHGYVVVVRFDDR